MKRIEVRLSLPVVAPLLDLIKATSDILEAHIAAPLTLEDIDADFRAEWKAELLEGQKAELHSLLALFDTDFFINGVVSFDQANAEAVVRACSALRLRLRRYELKPISDEVLESGSVDAESIALPMQKPYMAYVFLGTIQELIIQHLDSEILGETGLDSGDYGPDEDESGGKR